MQSDFSSARPHGPGRTPAFVFSALMLILGGAPPLNSLAQTAQQAGDGLRDYAVSGGTLDKVLLAIARDSGARISYDTDLVRPYQSAGLHGRYTVRQAIETVLRGTSLRLHAGPDGQWTIQRQAVLGQGGAVTTELPTITVNDSFALAATLTEDSPSYTADAVQIGSKGAQTLREIPQSVSVVTQRQIRDQGLRTLNDALELAPGITTDIGNNGRPQFRSRGFLIENVQTDGGTPVSLHDAPLAIYDHVELLRGADGVYVGRGDPGGSINLVRKRPTGQWRFSVEGTAGSWNNYGTVLDVGGPLGASPIRARLIASYDDKDFFYDTASERNRLLYGITETRIGDSTLLTLGGSLIKKRGTPAHGGVPFYLNGDDLELPRSASFVPAWAFVQEDRTELFAQLDHAFNERWSTRLNLSHSRSDYAHHRAGIHYGVNPQTRQGPVLRDERNQYDNRTSTADLDLSGRFSLLGREHDISIGGSYAYSSSPTSLILPTAYNNFLNPYPIDIWNFDPQDVPRPKLGPASGESPNHTRDSAWYARLRLHLTDKLRLGLGARFSNYEHKMDVRYWDDNGEIVYAFPSNHYDDRNVLTKYAGLTYDLNSNWTLYGSYADVYLPQTQSVKLGGGMLRPVVGSNIELGVKNTWLDGRLQTSLSVYRIKQNNMENYDDRVYSGDVDIEELARTWEIADAKGAVCCFLDNGRLTSEGLDLEVSGDLSDAWKLTASYNYNRNKWQYAYGTEPGVPYHSQTPRHLFKLWTSYRLPGQLHRWTIAGGVQTQSQTYKEGTTPTFAWVQRVPYRIHRPGYTIFNAAVSYQINKQWHAQLNVNNVFDKTYYKSVNEPSQSNWYGTPRNFLLTVRGQF